MVQEWLGDGVGVDELLGLGCTALLILHRVGSDLLPLCLHAKVAFV